MIHPFSSITTYNGADFKEYLKKIHLLYIFQDVFKDFPEHAFKIISFIVYSYSIESDMLYTDGISWVKLYGKICDRVGLNPKIIDVDTFMSSDSVQCSIQKWLQFQNDENFTQWCVLRDVRRDFLKVAAVKPINTVTTLDNAAALKAMVEAKMNAAKYSQELYIMMKDTKAAFVQNHERLKTSMGALDKATKERTTASIEDFIV